jgi:multiple sugar transport system substrate-binding protein
VTVKTDTTECKRAATMLDTLRENKTVPVVSVFTPEFVKNYAGKVLMMPGPAWYTGAIFGNAQSLNAAKGTIGVATPLSWGDEKAVTGNVGGATWFISSHSKNLAAASKFVQWVTTNDAYQVDLAPGYPAYAPAATKWLAKQQSSGFFATDLSAISTAAAEVWPGWGSGLIDQQGIWGKTMAPRLTAGKPIEPALGQWQKAITDAAEAMGYKVQ